jgi:hypothetical protein
MDYAAENPMPAKGASPLARAVLAAGSAA